MVDAHDASMARVKARGCFSAFVVALSADAMADACSLISRATVQAATLVSKTKRARERAN